MIFQSFGLKSTGAKTHVLKIHGCHGTRGTRSNDAPGFRNCGHPTEGGDPATCDSWGEGYKCSRMELCDPNTFAVTEASPDVLKEQTVNDLFSADKLFTQNDAGQCDDICGISQ